MTKKSRGNDVPETSSETVDFGRIANLGETVILSRGEVRVTEPTLEQILSTASELMPLFQGGTNFGDKAVLFQLLAKPETQAAVKKVAAVLTRKPQDFYEELPASDWLKLSAAFKRVVDWEKMKELFSQLGLETILTQATQ